MSNNTYPPAGNVPPQNYHYPPTPPPQPMYIQQRAGIGCFGLFFKGLAVVAVVMVCFFLLMLGGLFCIGIGMRALLTASNDDFAFQFDISENQLTEKFVSGNKEAKSKIAVISIDGVITEDLDGYVAKQIKQARDDKKVKAVVLRVESPGGTMTGSDYEHYLLKKMKDDRDIPIVVSMGAIAASGGYYVSMTGDEIFAEPSTITGSIGVIVSLMDGSELSKKIGVESTPVTSGPHKAMGNFFKKMSDDERKIWQNLVDDSFARFKDVIQDGRKKLTKEEIDALATGQIYTANEAVKNKLIDRIGYLDDAIVRASELADLKDRDFKTIKYKKNTSFLDALSEAEASNGLFGGKTLAPVEKALSDKTTPKVMAICPYVL